MNKIRFFKRKVKELALLTNIEEDIELRRDNRLGGYSACICLYLYCDTHEPVYLMRYNERKIKDMTKAEILNMIFHELGHIKFKHEYDNKKSIEQMEYEAEKFAIENIRRHYPQYFQKVYCNLKKYKTHDRAVYRKAFGKLIDEIKI